MQAVPVKTMEHLEAKKAKIIKRIAAIDERTERSVSAAVLLLSLHVAFSQ